jgi:hypothetical protein
MKIKFKKVIRSIKDNYKSENKRNKIVLMRFEAIINKKYFNLITKYHLLRQNIKEASLKE